MLTVVRTTLIIDDDVFVKAKNAALESGTSLSNFISKTLRGNFLQHKIQPSPTRIQIPLFRGSVTPQSHPLSELARLRDEGR